ncbi:MAG: HAMP domain-containing sensor histidine kinase, partial [Lachnospiraceae bacterium]|nr:HAMP domain-containing sensor histidine kinase [Lachnospiraceae bacterium]
ILGENGEIVDTPSNLSIGTAEESVTVIAEGSNAQNYPIAEESVGEAVQAESVMEEHVGESVQAESVMEEGVGEAVQAESVKEESVGEAVQADSVMEEGVAEAVQPENMVEDGGIEAAALEFAEAGTAVETETVTEENQISYPFTFSNQKETYTLCITPPLTRANQTLQALGQVAPWLLGIMLLFSMLGALFYSRWITRPIVRISDISRKMAGLDFSLRCSERREDEIGVLADNLNEMSDHLSAALQNLRTANAALQQDMEREREIERQRLAFFSAASHELKTPVTILKGQITGMLESVGVYQDREKYLAKSLQVTGRMEGLIREILTVSRMETNGFECNLRKMDLGELTRQQIALDAELIMQKELQLNIDLPLGIFVSADPALMRKALDNILSNAVFYAPERAELKVKLETKEEQVILQVENGGSRIPEEALPRVFDAFYRAEGSRNRRTGGSGLGLYIVRMILERHGAQYTIENTEDGVRFTMILKSSVTVLFTADSNTCCLSRKEVIQE